MLISHRLTPGELTAAEAEFKGYGTELTALSRTRLQGIFDHQRWLSSGGKFGKRLEIIQGFGSEAKNYGNADLASVDFSGAKLECVAFALCDLRNASFRGAELTDVYFLGCKFEETDFRGVWFNGVDFRETNYKKAKFDPETVIDRRVGSFPRIWAPKKPASPTI